MIENLYHNFYLPLLPFGFRVGIYSFKHELPKIQESLIDFIRHHNVVLAHACCDYVVYKGIKPLSVSVAYHLCKFLRNITLFHDSAADRIIHIVMHISYLVGKSNNLSLKSGRCQIKLMIKNTVLDFPRKIESLTVIFKFLNYP